MLSRSTRYYGADLHRLVFEFLLPDLDNPSITYDTILSGQQDLHGVHRKGSPVCGVRTSYFCLRHLFGCYKVCFPGFKNGAYMHSPEICRFLVRSSFCLILEAQCTYIHKILTIITVYVSFREFNFRVKSISMCTFDATEVMHYV